MKHIAFTLLALAALSSTAAADAKEECEKAGGEKVTVKSHVEIVNGRSVVVVETKVLVCGHPARPQVAYVTKAKDIDYAWESLEQGFLPRILGSVKKAPL